MRTERRPTGPRITLNITQEIIDTAIPRDSQHCMFADAIKTAYPDASRISVDLATVRFTDPTKKLRFTYLTPRVMQVELVRFDQGRVLTPFKVKLRGAHVTRAGNSSNRAKRVLSEKEKQALAGNVKRMHDTLKRTGLRRSEKHGFANNVPERVGGKPPPVQKTGDGVPFSRRRAYGLRALEF